MKIKMLPESAIRDMVVQLLETRTQAALAAEVGVKKQMVSIWKAGDQLPSDENLATIVRLHGQYNLEQMRAHKWLLWIMQEKHLSPNDLEKALMAA